MSVRYFIGYGLVLLSRIAKALLAKAFEAAALAEQFSVIIWTPSEIDRYAKGDWDHRSTVLTYSQLDQWLDETEKSLIEKYFTKRAELLNVACGAGREALLLARRGLRVTATDWGPGMITAAQRRAREAGLPIRFAVADMFSLPYREQTFDHLLLTNIAYSYIFVRRRRIRFLGQAHSVLKSGGIFIISFARAWGDSKAPGGLLERLFMRLSQRSPFNREYEPGDRFSGTFTHFFRSEELAQEFQEAQFLIKDWLWDKGYAVLVKL